MTDLPAKPVNPASGKEKPAAKSAGKKNPGSAATRTGKFINKTRELIV